MPKKIVCYCQDVTEQDLVRAIEEGYDHPEMLKRYTGVFMGPCQGKMCGMNVLKVFSEKTGRSIENLRVPTMRPPVEPVPMGWLAAQSSGEKDEKDL